MKFIKTTAWEFVQNLPLVAGLFIALSFWQQGMWALSGVCALISSILGALLIGMTESKIVQGHREPLSVIITNSVMMTLLMIVSVAYLAAGWSNWKTDIIAGALVGALLGAAQSLAAHERIGVRHCLALAIVGSLALIGIRTIAAAWPLWANILIMTLIVTVIVAGIDYSSLQ